jgi:hypothetical protein
MTPEVREAVTRRWAEYGIGPLGRSNGAEDGDNAGILAPLRQLLRH